VKRRYQLRLEKRKGVRLDLNDLKRLVEIFKESGKPVEIQTPSHTFESIDELRELEQPTLKELTISLPWPSVSLDIDGGAATLRYSDDSLETRGIVDAAREVISNRQSWWLRIIDAALWLQMIFVIPVNVLAFVPLLRQTRTGGVLYILLYGIWGALALTMFYSIARPRHGVMLTARGQRPSFMARHGADIIKGIITAVIGAVLTAVVLKAMEPAKEQTPKRPTNEAPSTVAPPK